jgi:hypothetical protein
VASVCSYSGYYLSVEIINKLTHKEVSKRIVSSGYILGCLIALVPFSFFFNSAFLWFALSMNPVIYIGFILFLIVIKLPIDKFFSVSLSLKRILTFIIFISLLLFVIVNINRSGVLSELRIDSSLTSPNDLHLNYNLLVKTRDNGFIIGVNNLEQDIIKFDNKGNEEWSKKIFEEKHTYPFSITTTNDDGFIILSKNNYFNSIDKIDSHGNIQWEKSYKNDKIENVTNLVKDNNSFYFAYVKDSLVTFVELNENGQEINTMYTSIKLSYNPDILLLDSSGNYIVAPSSEYHKNNITKISKNGKILQNETVDMLYLTSIHKTDQDNYIVTGREMKVAKLDKNLKTIWIKRYGSGDDVAMSAQKIDNSKYIIVGRDAKAVWMDPITSYGWLIKIDDDGNLISSDLFSNGRDWQFDYFNQVIQTEDNCIIATGYKKSGKVFWVLKLEY